MNSSLIIALVFILILIIGVAVLIAFNVRLSQTRIDPKTCPSSNGEFGVTGGHSYRNASGTAIIAKCGPNQTSLCQTTAQTIGDAIVYCNTYVNVCDAFVYSVATKQVAIVDTNATYVADSTYDVFKRQYATIQI